MGFFNKLLGGRKKKKDEEETEATAEPERKQEPAPKAEVQSRAKPAIKADPEPEAPPEADTETEPETEPEHAAPTESMSDVSSGSGRGVVQKASGSINTGSSGASLRAMSSGSLRAAPNMIQCENCERDLPVPLASGITVTCPFCLGRTAYKP